MPITSTHTTQRGRSAPRRRITREHLRDLAELDMSMPGATTQQIAEAFHVHRRTVERLRNNELYPIVLREVAASRVGTHLLPRAFRSAEKILDAGPSAGSAATNLILEVLRAQALVGPSRLQLEHSGRIESAEEVKRDVLARILRLAQQPDGTESSC